MQTRIKLTALLNAALLLTGIGNAQSSKPVAVNGPNPQEASSAPKPDQNEAPNTAPVFWITSVEVLRSTHPPQLDVVRVRGLVTTEGWESVELVPLTKGVPADGILDLALIAEAPSENTAPTSYPGVEAILHDRARASIHWRARAWRGQPRRLEIDSRLHRSRRPAKRLRQLRRQALCSERANRAGRPAQGNHRA